MRILHMVCTALLVLSPYLFTQGCSSAQQEDGDLEGEQAAENTENADGNVAEENLYEGGDEEMAAEEGENFNNEGNQFANVEEGDSQVLESNQTQSDLEDIIAGQNAEPVADVPVDATPVNAAPVDAAPVDAAPVDAAPVDAVADTSSAPVGQMAAPAMSAGPALPEQGSKMPYIVRVGDSLSSIAKMIYGSSDKWSEMAELSSIKNPNLVRPGDVVYYQLSQETLAFATAYEGAPRNELTVQRGDTLAAIAQRVYGNQGDWKFVWRQNTNIDDPDRLEVGQTIYYLTPASLSAAIEFAKTLTIAELLGKKIDNVTQVEQNLETPAQTIDQQTTNSDSVNGFELAKGMFNVFTSNFANAG